MKKLLLILLFSNPGFLLSQEQKVVWMNFEQLEDSGEVAPKSVFIYFYADWCVYCKKMERHAFKNPEIIKQLNSEFYPVKMDANSTKPINFDGRTFVNAQVKIRRNPIHQLPLLLANRRNKPFSLPALLLLDENFIIQKRSFVYLTSEELQRFLTNQERQP